MASLLNNLSLEIIFLTRPNPLVLSLQDGGIIALFPKKESSITLLNTPALGLHNVQTSNPDTLMMYELCLEYIYSFNSVFLSLTVKIFIILFGLTSIIFGCFAANRVDPIETLFQS